MNNKAPVITVDGPSGVGKGTLSVLLAERLGWHFLESGAIYRVVALVAQHKGIAWDDETGIATMALNLPIQFHITDNREMTIEVEGRPWTDDIRSQEAGEGASKISALPRVRQALLQLQRDFQTPPGLVADGRDMGTVVFPNANLKLFLTASIEERAKRRHKQLQQLGIYDKFDAVMNRLKERDERDRSRTASPTQPARDAIILDTTDKVISQVLDEALGYVSQAGLLG